MTLSENILSVLAPSGPLIVYLFGSGITGRTHPASDIDIAVLFSEPMAPVRLFELKNQIAETLSCDVDLIDLAKASTVLRKEVLRTGRVIFEGDLQRREQFEMYALSDYARLNEERAPILARLGHPLPLHA
jgi:predicted nucleotidyltransferase